MLDIRRHVIDGGRAAAGYFGGGVLWMCRDYRAAWVDATAIPFPIQMDLWYELIETV
jgi:hypothetical protein